MTRYNHMAGLKIVGEVEPAAHNRVEVVDEVDDYGLRIPKVTFSYSENDRRLIRHALSVMPDARRRRGTPCLDRRRYGAFDGGLSHGTHAAGQRDQRRWSHLGHSELVDL